MNKSCVSVMGKVSAQKDTLPDSLPKLVSADDFALMNSCKTPPSPRYHPPPHNVKVSPPDGPKLKLTTTEFQATPTIKVRGFSVYWVWRVKYKNCVHGTNIIKRDLDILFCSK